MQLSQFKVIPQNNVRKGEVSLEDLKLVVVPEVIKPDLSYDVNLDKFKITSKFVKEQDKDTGFTAITDGISVYLLRTKESDSNADLRPRFFRGSTVSTTSDYLRLLTKDLGNDLFLHETKIEDYQAFLVSNNKVSPFESEILLTDYVTENTTFDVKIDDITSSSVTTEVTQTEDPFTYTSDLLDQPVEENVEEPSLF